MVAADPVCRDSIQFLLNGERHSAGSDVARTTVLRYLRNTLGLTGTKEGCGTGHCGACTAVVGEPGSSAELHWRPINTCLTPVAAIAGKALVTVEGLSSGHDLHSVQKVLVRFHASQCGFCTPGMVMTLFALTKRGTHPGRERICEALAGNLCRCTGYRPIIDAADELLKQASRPETEITAATGNDSYWPTLVSAFAGTHQPSPDRPVQYGESFLVPASTAQADRLLEQHPAAILIAGGTDLLAAPDGGPHAGSARAPLKGPLISLAGIPELKRIEVEDRATTLGAMVSIEDAFIALIPDYPTLDLARKRFAGPAIRASATLGGNLACASPVADWTPILIALEATLQLRSADGSRLVSVEDFVADVGQGTRPQEYIEWVRVPRPRPAGQFRCYKVSRRKDQDTATVSAALSLEIHNGIVERARIAYGGLHTHPRRALTCERALTGRRWSADVLEAACRALEKDIEPGSDVRGSREYRMLLAANLLRRFRLEIEGTSPVHVWDYGESVS